MNIIMVAVSLDMTLFSIEEVAAQQCVTTLGNHNMTLPW
jgi:hypothetical protein